MQKRNCWCLEIIFLIVIFSFGVSGLRINEVMPDCGNQSSNCEWIELYADAQINLTNLTLDTSGQNIIINKEITDFLIITKNKNYFLVLWNISDNKIIEWAGMGLVNSGDSISLLNSSGIVNNFTYVSSEKNESWQLYNGVWQSCQPTPGIENFCPQQNQTQNQTSNIYLELDYDKAVRNEEVFKIKVKAYNLGNKKYDVKVYIEDNETIISEIYDDKGEEWKSGDYYVDEVFSGAGNKSESLRLRIKEKYEEFYGDAKVKAKLRVSGFSEIIAEIEDNIEIEEKKEEIVEESSEEEVAKEEEIEKTGIIKLNQPKDINISNNIYKSKIQYIKEYGIYGFALFCVFVIIVLLIKKEKIG